MTITDYEVTPLFIEPFFRGNIGHAISDEQVAYIKELKMRNNVHNLISENLYIFEEPELKSIKLAVQEALDIFANQVMGISNKLYVTQSWSLINKPGVAMHAHSHSNSVVSGSLYFCDMAQPTAGMLFERHAIYQRLQMYPEKGKVNLYNTTKNLLIPKKNDLFLFGSELLHLVQENLSHQDRYSIAFNTFIKGRLGSDLDVSVVNL